LTLHAANEATQTLRGKHFAAALPVEYFRDNGEEAARLLDFGPAGIEPDYVFHSAAVGFCGRTIFLPT
jgi:hypothetical protein